MATKRRKTSTEESQMRDGNNQQEKSEPVWSLLPRTCVGRILSLLQHDKDRLAMCLVCQSWASEFRNPTLWRTRPRRLTFGIGRDESNLYFAENFGFVLQELSLVCENNEQNAITFLDTLISKNTQLKKLTINLRRLKRPGKDSLIAEFIRFLARQPILKYLDVVSMETYIGDVFPSQANQIVSCLKTLTDLRISCHHLTSENLPNLAKTCPTLENLTLTVNGDEHFEDCVDYREIITTVTWKKVKNINPKLGVHMEIEADFQSKISRLLVPEIPLKRLVLDERDIFRFEKDFIMDEILGHISRHFSHSLVDLQIYPIVADLNCSYEVFADLLKTSDKITTVSFRSVCSYETFERCFQWLGKNMDRINYMYVLTDEVTLEDGASKIVQDEKEELTFYFYPRYSVLEYCRAGFKKPEENIQPKFKQDMDRNKWAGVTSSEDDDSENED